jgi:hypothetical protein
MTKKPSAELTQLYKDLGRILADYEDTSAIMVQVRIFDGAAKQQDLIEDWDVLLDKIYGPDKHRLKIARIPKGAPHG